MVLGLSLRRQRSELASEGGGWGEAPRLDIKDT